MQSEADRVATFTELRSEGDRLPAVCERVDYHHARGRTIVVYCRDEELAAELDSQLWTFRQSAFIPHVLLSKAEEPLLEPVVITTDEPGRSSSDVLVLATAEELPPWFARFCTVCDFAATYDEAKRLASRRRFAALREAGYRMQFVRAT